MVLFMGKMSFSVWSKLDPVQDGRNDVTYMDREVAGNRFDKMRPVRNYRFANYEHNCPDREHSYHGSDNTSQLDNSMVSILSSEPQNREVYQ